jgi:hypothetical protein
MRRAGGRGARGGGDWRLSGKGVPVARGARRRGNMD